MKIRTGLNWLRTGFHDRFLKLLYECSGSTNLGEFTDNEQGKQGFAPIVRPGDHGVAAHSDIGKQWLKLRLLLVTLLLLLLLKKYSKDFLASRPPFRATGRQLRHNLRGITLQLLTYNPVPCS
jgi:hypothetical protein